MTELAKALSGSNRAGKISFGTEGGLFQKAAFPTVVCGPGSIEQAHKPDEWFCEVGLIACVGLRFAVAFGSEDGNDGTDP